MADLRDPSTPASANRPRQEVLRCELDPSTDVIPAHLAFLTDMQRAFVLAVARGQSGTDAYCASHPDASRATAAVEACKLRRRPEVRDAISIEVAERYRRMQLDDDEQIGRVLGHTRADVTDAYGDDGRLLNPIEWPESVKNSVESIEVREDPVKGTRTTKIKLVDKLASSKLLFELSGRNKPDNRSTDILDLMEAVSTRAKAERDAELAATTEPPAGGQE